MTAAYDVVVVGLGIMGSAIAAELARRDARVLGLEARWPLHDRGASTGESRIFRRSNPRYPSYARDSAPALHGWRSLEAATGTALFLPTGGLSIARRDSRFLPAAAAAAAEADVRHRMLTAADLRREYPHLRLRDDSEAFLDEDAGLLLAEACLTAYQRAAIEAGAELRFGAPVSLQDLVERWPQDRALSISGTVVRARQVVIAAGAWLGAAPPALQWPRVWIERTVTHWFSAGRGAEALAAGRSPFVEWLGDGLELCLIPAIAGPIKVKTHHSGQAADPSRGPAPPTEQETEAIGAALESLSGLRLTPVRAAAAMYTNTEDGSMQVLRHPSIPDLVTVAACSGHGFKFAPVVAARTAALVQREVVALAAQGGWS